MQCVKTYRETVNETSIILTQFKSSPQVVLFPDKYRPAHDKSSYQKSVKVYCDNNIESLHELD